MQVHTLGGGLEYMNDTLDYYQLLHVNPDAPAAIIKASYRTLMQALRQHPDLGGDHAQAALINEAYATLTDVDRRRAYDAARQRAPAGARDLQHADARQTAALPRRAHSRCPFCQLPHTHGTGSETEIGIDAHCERCASPLRPSMRIAPDGAGQRALERYPRRAPVQLWSRWDAPQSDGVSLDVSLKGMLIETPAALEVTQLIRIECALCAAVGKVVHLRDTAMGWQVGLEFQTLRFHRSRGAFVSTQA